MPDATEQCVMIVNLIDLKRNYYYKVLVNIEYKKECKKFEEC